MGSADRLVVVERVLLLDAETPPKARVMRRDFNSRKAFEDLTGEMAQAVEEAIRAKEAERAGVDLDVQERRPANFYERVAQWAYALTASWREDNGDPITYREFLRQLPADDEGIMRISNMIDTVMGFRKDDPGNAEAGATPAETSPKSDASPSQPAEEAPSPGPSSTTSEP